MAAAAVHRAHHHHASSWIQELETVVCRFWLQGRCTRNPCKFAHELPSSSSEHKQLHSSNLTWRRPSGPVSNSPCSFFLRGSPCPKADDCKFLHAHTEGAATLFTELEGHGKAGCSLTGIALPQGSNILYTGGRDRKVKVWNCESGQCIHAIPLEGEIGCLFSSINDPDWLFVGIPDQVQVWNLKTQAEQKLCAAPAGQVRALAAADDMLFVGTDSGVILRWRFDSEALSFVPAVSLSSGAHSGPVHTLEPYMASDTKILFSGSADGSIRVWDLATGHCLHTLPAAHTGRVTGLLTWNQFLLSASLDGTLKVWRQEGAQLDLHYTHTPPTTATGHAGAQTPGLIAFSGCVNEDGIPILMCSYAGENNVVRVYELPSFTERAVLFSAEPIQSLETGPNGLAFSGDRAGRLKVWRTWGVQQQQQQ